MIESFDCDEKCKIFDGQRSQKLPHDIQNVARRKLKMIDAAKSVMDLKVPPINKHKVLKGKLQGWHEIRINDQWRVLFLWDAGKAMKVQIKDIHD